MSFLRRRRTRDYSQRWRRNAGWAQAHLHYRHATGKAGLDLRPAIGIVEISRE